MTGPTPATMFDSLGTLASHMDFTSIINFGWTIIQGKVLSTVFMTPWAPLYITYFGSAMEFAMTMVAAGYVIVHAVECSVSFVKGFYFLYADWSTMANLIWLWELFAIASYLSWALLAIFFGFTGGAIVWSSLDSRVAEVKAEPSQMGIPLQWDKALKAVTLCLLLGLVHLIVGYSLGDVSSELLSYYGEYDDDEKKEATDKDDGKRYPDGSSALADFLYQMTVTVVGWSVLTMISVGGAIFKFVFIKFDDDFDCDLVSANYSSVATIMSKWDTTEACLKGMVDAFKILDVDNDHMISRCEDASYQVAMGASKEYALKYSTSWSLAAAQQFCYAK